MIYNREETNEIKMKRTIAMLTETKSWFFENIDITDKLYSDSREKKKRTEINKIRNEKIKFTTDTTGMQKITRDY